MKIYGIDAEGEYTAGDVKEALVECFYQAHCVDAELFGGEEMDRMYCSELVKNAFEKTGGNFESPTKSDLDKVVKYLAEFSANFRSDAVINKHMEEIGILIDNLK